MVAPLSPPVMVLGCHRSGTSAVMGLLHHGTGLALGDLMPPSHDNPRGYFEAAAVVAAHRGILGQMERDWTCPPAQLSPAVVDRAALVEALEQFRNVPVWGIKDPRLLFLLPAWRDLTSGYRLVGVIRNPDAVTRSIIARDGLPADHAHRIVTAHVRRLAALHDSLHFPIVDFDAAPDEVVARVGEVAMALGLPWEEGAARRFYAPSLIHHRTSQSGSTDHEALVAAATTAVGTVPTVSDERLAAAFTALPPAEELPTTWGLQFLARRRAVLRQTQATGQVTSITELLPDDARDTALPTVRVAEMRVRHAEGPDGLYRTLRGDAPPAHLAVTGVLDVTAPIELPAVLDVLDRFTRPFATAHLEALLVDEGDGPVTWPRLGLTSTQTAPPYHHVRSALDAALAGTSWQVTAVDALPSGRSVISLSKGLDAWPRDAGPAERRLLGLEARLAAVEETLGAAPAQTPPPVKHGDAMHRARQADAAYRRLAERRSVKLALRLADLIRPLRRRLGR